MVTVKQVFNSILNLAIIVFAILFFISGFVQVIQSTSDIKDLKQHKGTIERKVLKWRYSLEKISRKTSKTKDSSLIFLFSIHENSNTYTASKFALRLNNLLEQGDSVDFYIKEPKSWFGNFVATDRGGFITKSPYEVFHLVSNKYSDPLIDFHRHKRKLLSTVWLWFVGSVIFFGWYFYRKSGRKHPLITA